MHDAVFASRAGPSIGCRKKLRNASPANRSGIASACGYTSFSSSPEICFSSAVDFGDTHTQSSDFGAATVPFVSTATSNLRACSATISSSSSCSKGSPPVHTT